MKNTSASLFRQVRDSIPKREIEKIVMKYDGDKRKQSFDCWAHFVSMIFLSTGSGEQFARDLWRLKNLRRKAEPSWRRRPE